MALRPSIALRNAIAESVPLKRALSNCVLKVYSGSQPATAEAAPTGTLLCTYSLSSGTPTREVLSTGSEDLTAGTTGGVATFVVNTIEIMGSSTAFDTSLAVTAAAVITKINDNPKNHLFDAYISATDVINIRARPGMGTLPNTWVVDATYTGDMAGTSANMASGVSAANCLNWGDSAAGVLTKKSTETWSGVAAATGTAGWFRFEASVSDAGGLDSSEAIMRLDGAVATSGSDLNMTPTAIVIGATQTVSSCAITFPTA
jgi:hypothetical protein